MFSSSDFFSSSFLEGDSAFFSSGEGGFGAFGFCVREAVIFLLEREGAVILFWKKEVSPDVLVSMSAF